MSRVTTHYETLKVTRDAPAEVIRAAYRSLSQKFHPDHNSGKVESEETMKLINTAYDVLSDPARRRAHDAWILSTELNAALAQPPHTLYPDTPPAPPRGAAGVAAHLRRTWWRYGAAVALLAFARYLAGPSAEANQVDRGQDGAPATVTAAAAPGYRRPFTAPNGAPWPPFAAYITGLQTLKADGQSKITIDNGEGDADVFVKLVSLEKDGAFPVRQLFIPAHARFVLNNVSAGTYDIRYRDLGSGVLARSEYFTVDDKASDGRKEPSDLKLNLARVRDSKMQMYPLNEGEF